MDSVAKITYYGHSTFLVEVEGKKLLFDPYIRSNPLAAHIDMKSIQADYILISHGHRDHIEDAVELAQQTGAYIISNYEIVKWLKAQGLAKTYALNTGGHWMFDFGKIKAVAAVHSSSLPDGSYGGTALGFLIETSKTKFYFAGDTALTYDMKLIGDYKKIAFAFLPIGGNYTMNVDNAIIATQFIKCSKIVGMHYNTKENIKIDTELAVKQFEREGKELILFEIGETKEI